MVQYMWLAPLIVGYLVLVRVLRCRRIEQIQKQHGRTPAEFESLNYKDAQSILGQLVSSLDSTSLVRI